MKPERDLSRLRADLDRARDVALWPDERLFVKNERVSAWSPAQHLDHLTRVLERVFRTLDVLLEDEDPRILNTGRPLFVARMMLLSGWIPRGRGEAPDEVLPDPRPVRHRVKELLAQVTRKAEELAPHTAEMTNRTGRIPHPLLGAFDASEWMRFAHIHTKHHLGIIGEIDQRRAVGAPVEDPVVDENGGCEAPARSN